MAALPTPRRLLIRGVNWLGDAVMTTPALMRLREALPETRITLVTPAKLADLWPGHPAVDDTLPFVPSESVRSIARRLRPFDFTAALILPNSPRSALEPWFARIPRRVGYARAWRTFFLTHPVPPRVGSSRMRKPSLREIRRRLAGETVPRPSPAAHHTHDYLNLAAAFGANPEPCAPRLHVDTAEIAAAREKFGMDPAALWLGLNPGAEYGPAKRWPADRFEAVAAQVSKATGARWVVLGGPKDLETATRITHGLPAALNLAGRTSLRELMAVMAGCRLVLTNDTGPMHVAAALGIPVVVPFGSTSPELTGPGLPGDPRHRQVISEAACAPCFLPECPIDFRCMLGIEVSRITAEVLQALAVGSRYPS